MASSNNFLKQIQIGWEKFVDRFEDALVMSRIIGKQTVDARDMERSNNVMWVPKPYILQSADGSDQTGNFQPKSQLAVPTAIQFRKSVTFSMSDTELLDEIQQDRMGDGAWQILASNVNLSVVQTASQQGTLVLTKTGAASLYNDIAKARTMMSRVGIPLHDRFLSMNSTDFNGLAADLANRQDLGSRMSQDAYSESRVGKVAGFELFEMDYGVVQPVQAGGGGLTMTTLAGGVNEYTPASTIVGASGVSPLDNRYQTITGTAAWTGVKIGDCFTIAGVNEVHQITKQDTGFLKTFRVALTPAAGSTSLVISPPIVSNQTVNPVSTQYQNCVVNAPSATSAVVFLNTVAATTNPFWSRNAIVLTPGRMAPPTDAGAMIKTATTDNGIEVTMWKQADIKTGLTLYRYDIRYGVNVLDPEQCGIYIFNQV